MKVENIKIQYKIASEIQKLTNIFLTVWGKKYEI
jgi:hypothetical protein